MAKNKKVRGREADKKEVPGTGHLLVYLSALVWIALVFVKHYSVFPVELDITRVINGEYVFQSYRTVFQHLANLAVLAITVFSLYAIGGNILRVCGVQLLNGLERFVFSESLGFAFVYLSITALSFFNLANKYSAYSILLLPVIYEAVKRVFRAGKGEEAKSPEFKISDYLNGPLDYIVSGLLLLILFFNLAAALNPEVFYDTLLYHLGVPNQYKLNSGFAYLPYNLFSNMPLAHGMIYLFGLILKDEIIPKLFNYFASVLIVLSIMAFGLRFFSFRTGLWAAAVFYSIFHVVMCAWQAGTEMFLTLFTFLSFYMVLLHDGNEKKYLTLSGIFSGMAIAVKYTGAYAIFVNLVILLFKHRRITLRYVKEAALLSLVSFAMFSPWLIKNYMYVKNPVYPFATNIFGLDGNSDANGLKAFITDSGPPNTDKLKNWFMLPFNTNVGKVGNNEYFTPVFLAILPFVWLLVRNRTEVYKLSFLYFGIFYLLWSCSTTIIRYFMPGLTVGAILVARALTEGKADFFKKIVLAAIIFSAYTSFHAAANFFYHRGTWRVFFGYQPKNEFLSNAAISYPSGYYDMADWINKNTGTGSKVLLFGDARTLYYERKLVSNSVYDKNALFEYLAKAADEDELYNVLKKDSIDYIAVNIAEAIRTMREYKYFKTSEKQTGLYNSFFAKHLREVYSKDVYSSGRQVINKLVVYEIVPDVNERARTARVNYLTDFILKQIN